MIKQYIHEAMKLARYKIPDNGSYYGDIPGFRGVLANAEYLEECRDELQETLEEWIILGIRLGEVNQHVKYIAMTNIAIIGGGLAGSEAAWQLAQSGFISPS